MLTSEYQIIISSEYQPYLKILDASIDNGETVAWAIIKKSYKKRALIVHPDKGGSEEAFKELNTAFLKLEHLIEHGTELEFDGLAEMSSSLDEILKELDEILNRLNAHFDNIHTKLDKINDSLDHNFSQINVRIDRLSASVDEIATSAKNLQAIIQRLDDIFTIDIPFYLGCYTAFLGSVISVISGKHQPQNARSMGAFVLGAGLIATGGYLVANSLFKKDKPRPMNENNEQATELTLVNNIH